MDALQLVEVWSELNPERRWPAAAIVAIREPEDGRLGEWSGFLWLPMLHGHLEPREVFTMKIADGRSGRR